MRTEEFELNEGYLGFEWVYLGSVNWENLWKGISTCWQILGHEVCPLWSRPPLFRSAIWIEDSDDVLKWALGAIVPAPGVSGWWYSVSAGEGDCSPQCYLRTWIPVALMVSHTSAVESSASSVWEVEMSLWDQTPLPFTFCSVKYTFPLASGDIINI